MLLLTVIGALVIGRALLPWAMEAYVNGQLDDMKNHTGSVRDIDVALVTGQYEAKGLLVEKRDGNEALPFLAVESVRFGLDWAALMHGEFVGDVRATGLDLLLVDGRTEAEDQLGAEPDWAERLDALMPFQVNRFDVEDGVLALHRIDNEGRAEQMVWLHGATLHARNFTNVRETEEPVFATLTLDGTVQEAGTLHLFAKIDPLSDPPVMSVDTEVVDLPLTSLNPLLAAYANVDAEAGIVEIFVEFASKEGRFEGYVKPLVHDAEFLRLDEEGSFLGKLWEGVVDAVKKVLENPETERVGAEVPLEGELTAVDAQLLPAVLSILENAFIEGLSVGIGNAIGLEDIGLGSEEEGADEAD